MDLSEVYSVRLGAGQVEFDALEAPALRKAVQEWGGKGTILHVEGAAFEQQYLVGHEDTLLCRVFRKAKTFGGLLVVMDATGLLLVALATTNLELVSAAGHFARMSTYIRYGADIFENIDAED